MSLYACNACGTVSVSPGEGDGTDDYCPACGQSEGYSEVGGGAESDAEEESEEAEEAEEAEGYECDECGRTFDSERGLNTHKRSHEDDE